MLKIYYHDPEAPEVNQPLAPSIHGAIVEGAKILLHRREDSPLWAFPGGKIEPGESAEQCLGREMKEELGVTVRAERLLGLYTDPGYRLALGEQVYGVFLVVFTCSIIEGLPSATSETIECRWFTMNEIDALETFPLVKEIARHSLGESREVYFD